MNYQTNILRVYPELESSSDMRLLFSHIELLFSMYSKEVTKRIAQEIPKATSRFIRMLLVIKYFNNSVNNFEEDMKLPQLKVYVTELKVSFADIPYIYDYFDILECLINEDYANSLKTTVRLGKENYGKGYIFDSYFPILSSYFYFKNKSLVRNSEFFEEKLNLLSTKLIANMPSEKRESFQNKYWAI
jgi:hypothetical protein